MIVRELSATIIRRVEDIYAELEKAYDKVAHDIEFSCTGCPDNCCDSYFLHYTYIEWSYLWLGVNGLGAARRQAVLERAHQAVLEAAKDLRSNRRPQIMCPLNEDGLCIIYRHRLMVCRTHGVPATLTRPDGKVMQFPGCFRCQELLGENIESQAVERTSLLTKLAHLENEYLGGKRHLYPKVRMTIAEMLVKGPPSLK
ncbi:MAG: hypothetical protein V2I36_11635 [Desulfopila sp.]|jgi:hypothetical protein|nr:hypothetical protein [Desulfopila sp.]